MKKEIEFEQILYKFKIDLASTIKMLIVFNVLVIVLKLIIGVSFPVQVSILLFIWLFNYLFIWKNLLGLPKTINGIYNLYCSYNSVDFLILTFIVYYLGASEWIGLIFYLITLALSALLLPRKKTILLGVIAFFFYACLLTLEFFEIIPHRAFFSGVNLYRSPGFVITQIVICAAVFYFIADSIGFFSEMLRQRQRQLLKEKQKVIEAYEKIEDSKKVLEVKVKARTKELEELTEKQESLINSRTEELTEKVEELEKFQKIAVGRELKMIELKEEIKRLEEQE